MSDILLNAGNWGFHENQSQTEFHFSFNSTRSSLVWNDVSVS